MSVLTKKSPYTTTTTHQQQQTDFVAIPRTTLHLYKTGHGNLHILDSDDQTRLYDIKTHSFSSPDISLYRFAAGAGPAPPAPAAASAGNTNANANANANNTILCGTAKFHDLSSTIDLQIIGPSPSIIPFKAPGVFSSSRTFESCVGELKWKHDMRLLNTSEEVVATFTPVKDKLSSFIHHVKKDKSSEEESKKWGWFEMAPRVAAADGGGQRLVDEIVLSGVALLEYERRATKYGAVGEAVGGVGEGVGAAVGGWLVC